ncbi:MAG: excinuclease ABC subunit UvrA [Candidatus Binatia bacterium]
MAGQIVIQGARVHNLKNIDLEIPRDQLVVITGVSGSGKSSLAFDTLFAEGQRRYLESLGADTRRFFRQMAKPDVDRIDGLSPAIAIQQKAAVYNPRSTVGTLSDIYDFLRLLFARVGQPLCVNCGREIDAQTIEQIGDHIMALPTGSRLLILAPVQFSPGGAGKSLAELARQGFNRVLFDGQNFELGGEIPDALQTASQLDLVVDRLVLRDGIEKRLADSLEVAARAGQQTIKVEILGAGATAPVPLLFSQNFTCVDCGTAVGEMTPSLFSFNSPAGACPACNGTGIEITRTKRVADETDATPCSDCLGTRLRKASLAVRIAGESIAAFAAASISENLSFLDGLELAPERKVVGQRIIAEIASRLRCLGELGLDYLSLDRPTTTLSGGELQRVRLATQIGSSLAGVLYILDEPSIGLHQQDNERLIRLLHQLRNGGNSVIVVEHDPETIGAADYVIDMGPGAGVSGGEVVAHGTPAELQKNHRSLTGKYLSRELEIFRSPRPRSGSGNFLQINGVRQRNLKNLTVAFPIGAISCVTGVSGAGKTTLVMEVLHGGVSQRLQKGRGKSVEAQQISGWESFDRVIAIDQSSIGRTARSNPATFMGLHDHLRELFAQVPEARVRGFNAERFSFNAKGGRCEACQGDGITRVEMYFLPEMFVTCESCKGRRYNRETLDVKYKGLSIADVLDLTVNQAAELLSAVPPIHDRLRMLREVGLGYLTLGQSAVTLSGGEAQRLKLARELARRSTGRSLYLLDEPTTGLHFDDIKQLLELLNRLTDLGNTMIIVEHNLEVIKCADFVLDLGPGGGTTGGNIVAKGTPEDIAAEPASATGRYLRSLLAS